MPCSLAGGFGPFPSCRSRGGLEGTGCRRAASCSTGGHWVRTKTITSKTIKASCDYLRAYRVRLVGGLHFVSLPPPKRRLCPCLANPAVAGGLCGSKAPVVHPFRNGLRCTLFIGSTCMRTPVCLRTGFQTPCARPLSSASSPPGSPTSLPSWPTQQPPPHRRWPRAALLAPHPHQPTPRLHRRHLAAAAPSSSGISPRRPPSAAACATTAVRRRAAAAARRGMCPGTRRRYCGCCGSSRCAGGQRRRTEGAVHLCEAPVRKRVTWSKQYRAWLQVW